MKKIALLLLLLLLAPVLPGRAAEKPRRRRRPPTAAPRPPRAPRRPRRTRLPAATAPAPPTETLTYGRFGKVYIYRRTPHPSHVAIFFSGDGGWNLGVVDMAQILADMDTLVVGVSVPAYVGKLNAAKESCTSAAVDLELLSKYVQKTLGLPNYEPPVLVGYSSGATLAYAALVQAPPSTFSGGIGMGFCPDLELTHPFCPGHGIASDPGPEGEGDRLPPRLHPGAALDRLPGDDRQGLLQGRRGQVHRQGEERGDACCCPTSATASRRPTSGRRSSARRSARSCRATSRRPPRLPRRRAPGAAPAKGVPSVADLPLVEVPAKAQGGKMLAVILSGDGGWAGIDKDVAGALSAQGIPVVGWNSLQYFWSARTPEVAARDLDRILRHYLAVWNRQEVLLIGYSFGADVLPFFANRLPADLLERVRLVALLGPGKTADFEFHVTDWLGGGSKGQPVLPEVKKLAGHPPVLCLYGSQEKRQPLPAGPRRPRQGPGAAGRPPLRRGLRRPRRADPQGGAGDESGCYLSEP